MSPETYFSLANLLVLPLWALMIFFPRWNATPNILRSIWVLTPIAALYFALIVPNIGSVLVMLATPTAAGIAKLLSDPLAATIAWAHFLTFDLFVGRWAYLDSLDNNFNPWFVSPVLVFILMLGPIGFLLYLGLRTFLLSRATPQKKKK